MKLDALDHVGLAVSDLAASIEFYEGVLGLTRAHEETWGDYPAVFEANGSGVALFSGRTPSRCDPRTRYVTSASARRVVV